MIYVTGGHEEGIGLEVFLKSISLYPSSTQSQFHLICNKTALESTLKSSKLSIEHEAFNITYVDKKPYSTSALDLAISLCKSEDILITLPTSKDQLILNGQSVAGHTEYFRKYFNTHIDMFFKSYESNVLLISDHIPLSQVSSNISSELINTKVSLCVDNYRKYFGELNEVYISGINPHAGENGILGHEDTAINHAISKLKENYNMTFKGPLAADGMLINNSFKDDRLFVYMYHDQGLAPFKSLYKTIGANISLGLPFLRLSVDHGTAFELYGKNQANYMGCYYVLNLALKVQRRMMKNG